MQEAQQEKSNEPNNRGLNNYVKYSGLAFQMGGVIAVAVWGGIKLDATTGTDPVFTIILSLLGVFVAIYIAIKDLIKQQ